MLGALRATVDLTAAEGAQLRAAIAAAAALDDYDTLANAPRTAQLCAAMHDQLRGLEKEVAAVAGPGGGRCVTTLRLEDGDKAATLSTMAQLGEITQLRTLIAFGHDELSLRQLKSLVLPLASEATLLQFFGSIPVGHGSATAARKWVGDS